MDITELEKLQQALDGALGIVREWQEKEEKQESPKAKWIVYLARPKDMDCYLDACIEEVWESAQKYYKAKTKLFIGTVNEVGKWYKARQKFAEVIKAWEDGKEIQCRRPIINTDWVNTPNPTWEVNLEYRVKPEEDEKRKRIEERASKFGEVCVRPEYDDEKCKKCNECIEGPDYRPFKDCDELIEFWSLNYQSVMRPANTKPFIWVRLKVDKRERLIVAYGDNFVEIGNKTKAVTLQHLFEQYEFLDGTPVGMEVEK